MFSTRNNEFLIRNKGGLKCSFPALQEAASRLVIQAWESCKETSSFFFFFLDLSFVNLRNRKTELELWASICMKPNCKVNASVILS